MRFLAGIPRELKHDRARVTTREVAAPEGIYGFDVSHTADACTQARRMRSHESGENDTFHRPIKLLS